MIYIYRSTGHWPIYSPFTGRLLTPDDMDAAAAYIIGPMQDGGEKQTIGRE